MRVFLDEINIQIGGLPKVETSPVCVVTIQSAEGLNETKGRGRRNLPPPLTFVSASLIELERHFSSSRALELRLMPLTPLVLRSSETTDFSGSPVC